MKDFTPNKVEMVNALGMALALIVPIWGGMYLIARWFGC